MAGATFWDTARVRTQP